MLNLKLLTPDRFAEFGRSAMAYLKPIDGGFAVYRADGVYLTGFRDRHGAEVALRQNDIEPVSVH